MKTIPLEKYPRVVENVTLDGVTYTLEFTWNDRFEYWVLTVKNSFDEILISEIKLVLGIDAFSRYARKNLPQGLIVCLRDKMAMPIQKITYDETDNGLEILYIEESDLAAV
jgi:hypothetical protein